MAAYHLNSSQILPYISTLCLELGSFVLIPIMLLGILRGIRELDCFLESITQMFIFDVYFCISGPFIAATQA